MPPTLLLFILLLFFLWGCGQWGTGLPEHIIAQINEEQIPVEEFDREFKELILEPGKEAKGTDLGNLKQAYLDQVIERKILVQEARRLGIKISQEELNQAISEIKMDYPGEGFGEKLGLKGMTLEEWKSSAGRKIISGEGHPECPPFSRRKLMKRKPFNIMKTIGPHFRLARR